MLPGASRLLSGDEIARRLRVQPDIPVSPEPGLRQAAVLVPLVWENSEWRLLFTRRTETVQSHKGQVSFPGGAAEPGDEGPESTALRETAEEIGLNPQDVRVLGALASRPTVTGYWVTPIVGAVRWPYELRLAPLEVSRVFTIPLDWLASPGHWKERFRSLPNGFSENVVHYQAYDGEILWGASARITLDLLQALQLINPQ
jgi:8-oxo-dGTP pyrophosphatase MutT (NUDIX family)